MPTVLKFILYPIFALVCLVIFSIILFPFDSVKSRAAQEVEAALGGEYGISIGHMSPSLLGGALLEDVEIRPRGVSGAEPLKISRARVKVALFDLISGTVDVTYDLKAGPGRAKGTLVWKKAGTKLDMKLEQFDIALAGFMAQKVGIPLSGQMNGTVALEMYSEDPLRNTGKIVLDIPNLKLGEIKLGDGAFNIPALLLAKPEATPSRIDVMIDKGNIEVTKIAFYGGDLELDADGKVYGARKADNYRFNLKGSFRVAPEMMEKLSFLAIVEKQKSADGSYPFTITGRINKPSIRIGEFKLPI